jgi:hypothetical protein
MRKIKTLEDLQYLLKEHSLPFWTLFSNTTLEVEKDYWI